MTEKEQYKMRKTTKEKKTVYLLSSIRRVEKKIIKKGTRSTKWVTLQFIRTFIKGNMYEMQRFFWIQN